MLARTDELADSGFVPVAVGFSPPEALAALAAELTWPHLFLADVERLLYARLGFERASVRRVLTPATLAISAAALARGERVQRPVEDIRQLAGDALVTGGVCRLVFRQVSPDDRPSVEDLVAACIAEPDESLQPYRPV